MKTNSDSCIATNDRNGVPYNERLRRVRQASGKSPEEIVKALQISVSEYDEWEGHAGEITRVMTLRELSSLASVLGVRTRFIFDDEAESGQSLSPEFLSTKINTHLIATNMGIAEFEDRVGFVVEPVLRNPAEVLEWNVDCLRFVCKEIGLDWLSALP